MTDQNNAAQAAEQAIKDAIRKAYDDGYNDAKMAPDNASTYCVESATRHGSAALLSKLRAEGVQAGDEPTPEMYAAAQRVEMQYGDEPFVLNTSQIRAVWKAMQSAALASAPVAGEARMPPGYSVKAVDGHGYRITPPTGSDWVAHIDTPAGDLIAALYAAPQASEAVRILFPTHLRKMWSGGEVQVWLDEHQGITPPKASAKGSLERYRKWQAEQAQADKDGGDCVKGAGYAGVTVWIGDRQATRVVTKQMLASSNVDELSCRFEAARAALSPTQPTERGERDA